MHPSRLENESLLSECEIRRQRRSGPGGQHRNKVETGVFIEHMATGIRAEATEQRSQPRNLELAVFRLRVNLALEHRSPRLEQPSELWRSRIKAARISVNAEHDHFPALLSEALDILSAENWDVKRSAEFLGCSTSQLVKFLKKDGRGFSVLTRQREELGLKRLR